MASLSLTGPDRTNKIALGAAVRGNFPQSGAPKQFDEVEVSPGVFRTAISVFLLDVNAEHVLMIMTYACDPGVARQHADGLPSRSERIKSGDPRDLPQPARNSLRTKIGRRIHYSFVPAPETFRPSGQETVVMRISKAVAPLLAAGFCTHCIAGHEPELVTMLDAGPSLWGRLGPDGHGTVVHRTPSMREFIRFGPDGVTRIPFPAQVPDILIPVELERSQIRIAGVGPENAAALKLEYYLRPMSSFACGVLDDAGLRIDIAHTDIAGPGVPLGVEDSYPPRSMNIGGNAVMEVDAWVGTIATYGPELQPRLHRFSGTPTPGLNAVFGITPQFMSPGRHRNRTPHVALDYDISSDGQVAYHAMFSEAGGPEVLGIFVEEPGADRLLLRADAPNAHGYRLAQSHHAIRVNAAGQVALLAAITDHTETESGIWSIDRSGEAALRIRHLEEFQTTSGGGTYRVRTNNGASAPTYQRCDFVLADNGDIAFGGVTDTAPGWFNAVFVFSGADGVNKSLLDFSHYPGINPAPNMEFGFWTAIAPDARSVAANMYVQYFANGLVFYSTIVVGTVDQGVVEIVRSGDLLRTGPDEYRQAGAFQLLDQGVGGRTLFRANFVDGSNGLFIHTIPDCPADLNKDGVVDADDFFLFLNFFAAGDPRADINNDGMINADDFFDYLDLFAAGC